MNEVLGYACACSKGYEPASQVDPSCVNINECQGGYTNPCHNGGVCHDLVPPPMVESKPGEELRFKFVFTTYIYSLVIQLLITPGTTFV